MNAVARALAELADILEERGRSWSLIGGLAVSCHVDPRFTRDVDACVVVADDADAEALVHAFVQAGHPVEAALEHDGVGRLATVRLLSGSTTDTPVPLDLMFASSGIEAEVAGAATRIEALPGLRVPVASRGHLIALKLLSVDESRLQDAIDLRALLTGATDDDIRTARAAMTLISERGYQRGRDLNAIMARYVPAP